MDYNNCYSPLCPRRETCILWLNALECVERGENLLCVINPKILEAAGGYDHCPLYYEYKLRQFARGLIWMYRELTVAQQEDLHSALISHFGYSTIVRMRCGYEAISPKEQATIASMRHGLLGSNLNTRASKSIMSSRRESRVGQRTNFLNE